MCKEIYPILFKWEHKYVKIRKTISQSTYHLVV